MNDSLFDLFDRYKIVTFLPKKQSEEIIKKLQNHNINKIGNYINCLSWCDVTSTWMPKDGATPFIGKVGEISIESEVRLEFLCAKTDLRDILKILKDIHPYEEVEIDIVPLISIDSMDL